MFGFKCKCLICSLLSLWFLPQNEASFTVNNDTEFSITLLQPENGTADEYVQQSHIDYQQMMCQNDSKCETGRSSIPQSSYDNLPQRICMCDDKCPMYNDCCVDADYHNGNESNFSCAATFLDGNIYMKEKCDSSSRLENTNITNYCHWRNVTDDRADIFLSIPVTSKKSNVTYRNLFCALCNDERNFTFWEVSFTPKPSESNSTSWHEILSRARARDRDFKVDLDSALIGNFNVNATLPKYLRSRVRRCIPEEFYSTGKTYENLNCSSMCRSNNDSASSCQFTARVSGNNNTMAKPTEVVTVRARNIPFYGFCARIPSNNSAWNLFCRENDTSLDGTQLTYIDQCFFSTTDGKPCLINSNFEPDEYILLDDETIFVYRFNSTFGSSEWSFVSDNSVYVCGTEIPQTPTERWFAALNRALSVILMSISKIFLILYFALFVSTKKMRHPFGKVIFCYSLTLMTMYAVFVVSDHLSSCEIMAAIFHYLLLSCFCWLTVAAYDCWRTVTASVTLTNVEGHSLRRLLCYCCIGWITPLSVLSVAIYFELSPVQSVACALKPGYGKLNKCFIAQQIPFKYFFVYPSSFMFSIMIYFFLRISVHVIFNASTHRNFCIFAKLALVTGIPWTIGLLITFTNGLIIRFIYCVLNSSQGIFIFLALAYDREVIKNKLISIRDCCCKKSDEHENGRVTFTKANTKRVSQTTVNEYF